MKILLFGASGFLGRHLRRDLAAGALLRCPDRAECDLVTVEPDDLVALLTREAPDAVVNAAGLTLGTDHELMLAHAAVTAKLVDAMAVATTRARLVRIGSAAEYGVVPAGHRVRESDPADPVGGYGLSQLTATRLAGLAARAGRLDTVVLRVFNPVGPGLPDRNLLGRAATLLRQATADGRTRVELGLHDTHRDFVDVRDVASAVWAALTRTALEHRVFNVGSATAVTATRAVDLLAEVAGFTGEVVAGAFPADAARSAAVPWMCADLTRSAAELGWTPRYRLTDSLRTLWAASTGRASEPRDPAGPAADRTDSGRTPQRGPYPARSPQGLTAAPAPRPAAAGAGRSGAGTPRPEHPDR